MDLDRDGKKAVGGNEHVNVEETAAQAGVGAQVIPDVITVDELANLLRVNRKTVYAAIKRGEIPGVQRLGRGGAIRISRRAVMEWLSQGHASSKRRSR